MHQVMLHAKLRALNDRGNWIQDVVESPKFRKGAFTKKAKAAGYSYSQMLVKIRS